MFSSVRRYAALFLVSIPFFAPSWCEAQNQIIMTEVLNTALAEFGYASPTGHSLGVVWVDINNDGLPDVFASNGYSVANDPTHRPHLYVNNGDGSFTNRDDLLPALPNLDYVGALAADYDRDGDKDIYVYTAHEEFSIEPPFVNPLDGPKNYLLKNHFVENGNALAPGMFVDVAAAANLDDCLPEIMQVLEPGAKYNCYQTRAAAFLDYDLDGWIDLYVGHMVMNRAGSTSDPMLDMVGKIANTDFIFRNAGDGTFTLETGVMRAGNATKRSALVAVAGHLNDDIWPDLYIGNVGNDPAELLLEDLKDAILINDGNGHLDLAHQNIGNDTPAAMGVDFADINFDGRYDIYISDASVHYANDPTNTGNTLYLSHADGFGQNRATPAGVNFATSWGVNFCDFDANGREDLFVASAFPNLNSTIFQKEPGLGVTHQPLITDNVRGSAIADYDRDGDPDLLIVSQNGKMQLYRNDSIYQPGSHITVELHPSASNLDAFGTRIVVTLENGIKIRRQVKGGTSSHSQDFNEVYFGTRGEPIEMLEIRWPNPNQPPQKIMRPKGTRIQVFEPTGR